MRYGDQAAELRAVREAEPNLARWSFSALQQVLRRLDQSFVAFFKRGRGFPRFRAASRYHAATFRVGDGLTIRKDRRIGVVGILGGIKAVWHRDLPPDAKLGAAILTRQAGKWFVVFSVEATFAGTCGAPEPVEGTVGIDLGLNSLIATSDGDRIEAPRLARRAHKAIRRHQRALARCRRGSRRRLKAKARLAAASAKVARQRRDFAHKLSRTLVSRYQGIAFEDLDLTGLKRGMLARSVHDAAWALLVQFVRFKAASAGAEVVLVDPRGTSQECPECGAVEAKTLATRRHRCGCGCVLDRDVAAAKVVHLRAFGFGPGHGLQAIYPGQAWAGRVAA